MKNKWHNTAHAQTLLRNNEKFLQEGSSDGDVFMNSQFVMTPQPPGVSLRHNNTSKHLFNLFLTALFIVSIKCQGVTDVVGLLFGAKSLRPVSLARELYGKDVLETFIRDRAENSWNIVLLDFLDLCPQLVRYEISIMLCILYFALPFENIRIQNCLLLADFL